VQCDDYAFQPGPLAYGGRNPALQPGSLLAVPPAVSAALRGNITTVPGRRLLDALTDYGGYITDDAAWVSAPTCRCVP
jgi:hypothetical protein